MEHVTLIVALTYVFSVIFSFFWLYKSACRLNHKKNKRLSGIDLTTISILSLIPMVNMLFGVIGMTIVKESL